MKFKEKNMINNEFTCASCRFFYANQNIYDVKDPSLNILSKSQSRPVKF